MKKRKEQKFLFHVYSDRNNRNRYLTTYRYFFQSKLLGQQFGSTISSLRFILQKKKEIVEISK